MPLALAIGLLFFPLCAMAQQHPSVVPEDEAYRRELVGSWCASDDEGQTCWGYDNYYADGTFDSCFSPESGIVIRLKGTYQITGRVECFEVQESEAEDSIPAGFRSCSELLEMNERLQRFRHMDTGKNGVAYRVSRQPGRCELSQEGSPTLRSIELPAAVDELDR